MNILCKKLSIVMVVIGYTLTTATLSWASSHMDAPLITLGFEANTSDVFAFRINPDREISNNKLGVIQNQKPVMVVGDVNSDDIPDIVISSQNNVSVLLGNGDGTFFNQVNTSLTLETGQCWSMSYGVGLVLKNSSTIEQCKDLGGKSWCRFAGSCDNL